MDSMASLLASRPAISRRIAGCEPGDGEGDQEHPGQDRDGRQKPSEDVAAHQVTEMAGGETAPGRSPFTVR